MADVLSVPTLFYGLLFVLFVASILVAVSMSAQERRLLRKKIEDEELHKLHLVELEEAMKQRELQFKELTAQKDQALAGQQQACQQAAGLESKLSEAHALAAGASALKAQLQQQQETAKTTDAARVRAEEQLRVQADELEKLKKETALTNQMYEGLKGQYEELEEKFAQLFQQFLEEQKKPRAADAAKNPSGPVSVTPKQEAASVAPPAPDAQSAAGTQPPAAAALPKIPNFFKSVSEQEKTGQGPSGPGPE